MVELNIESIKPIPREILDNHKDITMGMDIMFINGIPFLTTISCTVVFGTTTEIEGANMGNVVTVLKNICATYKSRGFRVIAIAADNGFKALKTNPEFIKLQIILNITEHNSRG